MYPSWETLPHERLSPRSDTVGRRLAVLRHLAHPETAPGPPLRVVVAPVRSVLPPQLRGLGSSAMAQQYGLASREEARAYLDHPVLGPRLEDCTALVNAVEGRSAEDILGGIDALKFRSCMTLFAAVRPGESVFRSALQRYFGGVPDPRTLALLDAG